MATAMRVNPTRMELTRIKRRLVTAKRGHKLLKDKRDEMVRQFIALVRQNYALRQEVEKELNMALSNFALARSVTEPELMEEALQELSLIAGQKAVITIAKKSIASFKLREGMPIGCRVTLRQERMWDFLDKLFNFALPRVRDFRGISDRGFDGRGNFTLGIKEHSIFPELEVDRIDNPKGMNITIVTSAKTDREGKMLLDHLGMPFRK